MPPISPNRPTEKRSRFILAMWVSFALLFGLVVLAYSFMYAAEEDRGWYFLLALFGAGAGGLFAVGMWKLYGERE